MLRAPVVLLLLFLAVVCHGQEAADAGIAGDAAANAATIDFGEEDEPVEPIVVERNEKKEFKPLLPERYRKRRDPPQVAEKRRGCGACAATETGMSLSWLAVLAALLTWQLTWTRRE